MSSAQRAYYRLLCEIGQRHLYSADYFARSKYATIHMIYDALHHGAPLTTPEHIATVMACIGSETTRLEVLQNLLHLYSNIKPSVADLARFFPTRSATLKAVLEAATDERLALILPAPPKLLDKRKRSPPSEHVDGQADDSSDVSYDESSDGSNGESEWLPGESSDEAPPAKRPRLVDDDDRIMEFIRYEVKCAVRAELQRLGVVADT